MHKQSQTNAALFYIDACMHVDIMYINIFIFIYICTLVIYLLYIYDKEDIALLIQANTTKKTDKKIYCFACMHATELYIYYIYVGV